METISKITENEIQNVIKNPEKYWINNEFPIGTIIPYIPLNGSINIPKGWTICKGQKITDRKSLLLDKVLPNLSSDVFLMGVSDLSLLGVVEGSNEIISDGNHTHGIRKLSPNNSGFGNDNADDQFITDAQGSHNHGGDKKPIHCGVLYLIRYK